jgi:hypothetical protein
MRLLLESRRMVELGLEQSRAGDKKAARAALKKAEMLRRRARQPLGQLR